MSKAAGKLKVNPVETVPVNELLTPAMAARLCKRPRATVYSWIAAGKLPAYRQPGHSRLFIIKRDVEALMKE